MSKWLSEIELKGSHVTLTPLNQSHSQELLIAASNNNLNDLWYTNIPDRNSIDQSRNAILRLGAKQDGILRSHSITQGGLIRDTVV